MIFSPDLAALVLSGVKTQTRRPVKNGKLCRYIFGCDYAVQDGRGRAAIGRIRILSVEHVVVADISRSDARAEGFPSAEAFRERWRSMYGHVSGWCWRIEFELVTA